MNQAPKLVRQWFCVFFIGAALLGCSGKKPKDSNDAGNDLDSSNGQDGAFDVFNPIDDAGNPIPVLQFENCLDTSNTADVCRDPETVAYGSVGAESAVHFGLGDNPTFTDGFLDSANEQLVLSALINTNGAPDLGVIATVDTVTGERKFISGSYDDAVNGLTQIGSGDAFDNFQSVQPGASSWFAVGQRRITIAGIPPTYELEHYIVSIDPNTGTRTLLWPAETDGGTSGVPNAATDWTCDGISNVIVSPTPMISDGSHTLYFTVRENSTEQARGLVSFDTSDNSCAVISFSGSVTTTDTGAGIPIEYSADALAFNNGYVWWLAGHAQKLFQIRLSDGSRALVSYWIENSTTVGNGDRLGQESMAYSALSSRLWTWHGFDNPINPLPQPWLAYTIPDFATPAKALDRSSVALMDNDPVKEPEMTGLLLPHHLNPDWVFVTSYGSLLILDASNGNANIFSR
ncbi:MAG: hypothetical protein IPJ88_17955 [Myxococcales bacterium]|nr:MAG: hypothetical protein IPJ88_17955 [Myxococcales bacterium]